MPATDKIETWRLVHLKEDVKLHILSRGWFFLRRSDRVGAGKCVKMSKI